MDIPVIFLTALNDVADKVRAFQVGGVDYITKPFQLEEVHVRVRTHLALRKARLDLEQNIEKLRALETLRDDLVCMIVHDMRSPLLALSVHLELVRMEAGSQLGEVAQGDLQAATQMSSRIAQMANDLLDVSRLEANKLPLERQIHDIGALVRRAIGALGVLGAQHLLELDCPNEVQVSCDEGLVRRVVENLLSNALKHGPSGSRVVLRVSAGDSGARVEVSDEGSGVPEAAIERIFQKFGVVSKGRDPYSHSAGLGLAFCKLAVQAHGGSIGVIGREPRGSTFWFELPA
jgi:signal transduction histidine kinase